MECPISYNRKYIFERIGIVEQDIRLAVVGTEAIGARWSCLDSRRHRSSRPSCRCQPARDTRHPEAQRPSASCGVRTLIREYPWQLHHGTYIVVHFEFLHTEHFCAARYGGAQDRQIFVHDRDEVIIDLLRNIACGKGRLAGRNHTCGYARKRRRF